VGEEFFEDDKRTQIASFNHSKDRVSVRML